MHFLKNWFLSKRTLKCIRKLRFEHILNSIGKIGFEHMLDTNSKMWFERTLNSNRKMGFEHMLNSNRKMGFERTLILGCTYKYTRYGHMSITIKNMTSSAPSFLQYSCHDLTEFPELIIAGHEKFYN